MAYRPCSLQGIYELSSWSRFRAYMLSALIRSQRSYPAVLLAEQLVHQRLVHSGPLVTCSLRSQYNANLQMYANAANMRIRFLPCHHGCRLYLYPSLLGLGYRHIMMVLNTIILALRLSRYGVNS